MGFSRYTEAFNRLLVNIKPVVEHYHTSSFRILFDAFTSYLMYGITPNQYIGFQFYRCSCLEKSMFYTARDQYKYDKVFNDPKKADIFWDKVKFNKVFSKYLKRAWIYTPEASEGEIVKFLDAHNKVIMKPTNLSSGRGIEVYNKQMTIQEMQDNKVLLEEFCQQHHAMAELNPSSVNTVRVYTLLDKKLVPHILCVSIRVGGMGAAVDNFHSGGVGYPVDIETGYVSGAGYDINGNKHLRHPGTGTKVIGFEIPNYAKMIDFVKKATLEVDGARLIAWDVAVLENGFEFIEGNYDGDSGFMQAPSKEGKRHEILTNL